MNTVEKISLGIAGACGRGGNIFKRLVDAFPNVHVTAVCDVKDDELAEAQQILGASERFTDYEKMIETSDLDAVLVGTPMPFHAEQSIAALNAGVHVLSEVPAAVSVQECGELTRAARGSSATYMMAENYIFMKPNIVVRELARRGAFGTMYYAEGEYLHELKGLNEITKWRRKWQTGINGVTYGTHSLGPILQWFDGERVTEVACAGSGHHYTDPRGDLYENEDSCVMLCRLSEGGLAKVRVDMLSDRPHAMTNYQLQGTGGCYESARTKTEAHRIWLKERAGTDENGKKDLTWEELSSIEDDYIPDFYREAMEEAAKSGHGGGDFFVFSEFVKSIMEGRPPIVGIDEAMDATLPGLVSQQSINDQCRWIPVPDSREW